MNGRLCFKTSEDQYVQIIYPLDKRQLTTRLNVSVRNAHGSWDPILPRNIAADHTTLEFDIDNMRMLRINFDPAQKSYLIKRGIPSSLIVLSDKKNDETQVVSPTPGTKLPALVEEDRVLHLYKTTGLYMRVIESIEGEKAVLDANDKVLKDHHITTEAELKKFFINDSKDLKAEMLPGFRFRPATVIKKGLAVGRYRSNNPAVLIDPREALATHFYKGNVYSNNISPQFNFARPNRIKDRKDLPAGVSKQTEKELRRCGFHWDNYNRNYGMYELDYNENLLHYPLTAVCGVLVGEGAHTCDKALQFKQYIEQMTGKKIKIYHMHPFLGLSLLTDADLAEMRKNEGTDQYSLERCKHLRLWRPEKARPYAALRGDITNIHCSLEHHDPSPQHPVSYTFFANASTPNKLSGKAYVKEGVPLVDMGNDTVFATACWLPGIASDYQRQQTAVCNKLLQTINKLAGLNVKKLELKFVEMNNKQYLQLNYEPLHSVKPEAVLDYIGYDLSKGWKWEMLKTPTGSKVSIRLSVLQSIDTIKNRLRAHVAKLENPQVHNVRKRVDAR